MYLITGSRSDNPTRSAINTLTAWVTTPTATPTQKQALTEVARAYLRGCNVQATPTQLALLNTLDRWEDGGWHEKTLEGVTVGWADGNGFSFRDEAERLKHRTGLSLQWPIQASRCQFSAGSMHRRGETTSVAATPPPTQAPTSPAPLISSANPPDLRLTFSENA